MTHWISTISSPSITIRQFSSPASLEKTWEINYVSRTEPRFPHQWLYVQSGASDRSLGFEDEDLGSSPGWRAATVATYCPSRQGELPKFLSSKPCEWSDAPRCSLWLHNKLQTKPMRIIRPILFLQALHKRTFSTQKTVNLKHHAGPNINFLHTKLAQEGEIWLPISLGEEILWPPPQHRQDLPYVFRETEGKEEFSRVTSTHQHRRTRERDRERGKGRFWLRSVLTLARWRRPRSLPATISHPPSRRLTDWLTELAWWSDRWRSGGSEGCMRMGWNAG